jgi:hypothetical protein
VRKPVLDFGSHDRVGDCLLERLRIQDLDVVHLVLVKIGSPALDVSWCVTKRKGGKLACDGVCFDINRSCCNVRSTVLCFWKFCRAFDGPHIESAMMYDVYAECRSCCPKASLRSKGEVFIELDRGCPSIREFL